MATLPCIYGLVDPRSGALMYIGKANNPANRLSEHIKDSRKRKTPVYAWIRELTAIGLTPRMRILVNDCEDWAEAEIEAIASARAAGIDLLNVAKGGNCPHCPAEVRSANGHKTIAGFLVPKPIKDTTVADVLKDTYPWLLNMYKALNKPLLMEATKTKMRELFQINPTDYRDWANV